VREKFLYPSPAQADGPQKRRELVDEQSYQKASLIPPQNIWMGTTVSEYTRRISAGVVGRF
jgi:hypothetical protein